MPVGSSRDCVRSGLEVSKFLSKVCMRLEACYYRGTAALSGQTMVVADAASLLRNFQINWCYDDRDSTFWLT